MIKKINSILLFIFHIIKFNCDMMMININISIFLILLNKTSKYLSLKMY